MNAKWIWLFKIILEYVKINVHRLWKNVNEYSWLSVYQCNFTYHTCICRPIRTHTKPYEIISISIYLFIILNVHTYIYGFFYYVSSKFLRHQRTTRIHKSQTLRLNFSISARVNVSTSPWLYDVNPVTNLESSEQAWHALWRQEKPGQNIPQSFCSARCARIPSTTSHANPTEAKKQQRHTNSSCPHDEQIHLAEPLTENQHRGLFGRNPIRLRHW